MNSRGPVLGDRGCKYPLCAATLAVVLGLSACGQVDEGKQHRRATPPAPSAAVDSPKAAQGPGLVVTPVTSPPVPAKPARDLPARRLAAPAAAAAPESVVPGRPGSYLFDETGFARIKGCLPLEQPAPTPTALRVDGAEGNRQHLERDQRNAQGQGSVTIADLEYRADGIYVVYLKQTQTLLLSALPTEFQPAEPALLLPARRAVGQTWSYTLTSRDGQVRAEFSNKVEALGENIVFSKSGAAPADRISTTTRVTGQSAQGTLDLTRNQVAWYAPEAGIQVKEVVDLGGRIGLCEAESHTEALIQMVA